MKKKNIPQQYVTSALNNKMIDYRVYVMDKSEILQTILLAFAVGGISGLSFYGGLFKNEYGEATKATMISNLVVFFLSSVIAFFVLKPMRTEKLLKKRQGELVLQFRSFLLSLSIALSSGMNIMNSLQSVLTDLKNEYSADSYIVREVEEMLSGMQSNIPLKDLMSAFASRSGSSDIENFASVFAICIRTGANMKDVVQRTSGIISEKITIAGEIETTITSNKAQFTVMMALPVVMVLLLRTMSSSFAESFSTAAGVVAITISIGLFVAAYKLGNKIMDIKGEK